MKLAVFFPASLFSAWACSYGLVNTLKRMGHEVTSVPIDPATTALFPAAFPQGEKLAAIEAFIVSGPEHIEKALRTVYPGWHKDSRRPTVAWMHETIEREDYGKLDVDAIQRSADIVFCPGKQDEKYGFRYLPFGVDAEVFHPDLRRPRTRDAGFIGLVYPKRQSFLNQLRPLLNGTKFSVGNVQVLEVDGVNPRKTAELYATNLRSFKVFVNLPTLTQLAVTKIYEALACGTPVLTPKIEHMDNLEGLPVAIYDGAEDCAKQLRAMLGASSRPDGVNGPTELRAFAATETRRKHSLELRCTVLLDALKELGAKAA